MTATRPKAEPLLEVRGVTAFYGDFQALWGVDLEVREGEVVTLLGANGAGKTTTLRVVSGLLRPASGSVRFAGEEITGRPAHRIVELGIAHVPEGRQLFPLMSVEENLLLGGRVPRVRARRQANLERMVELFPILGERRRQAAGTLSGGEQQMLAIARALMSEPRLLLLDEPSLGLAPRVTEEVFATVRAVAARGVTVLLVEQNVLEALEISDRGYVIEHGRIVRAGPAAELARDAAIREAYLGL
ncbi:MAG: ABC transporter ATP-binding protein [Firmicutes bacterium]|nr:ABC transporter ATP-binding protein [Bacillota bacterium]